MGRSPRYCRKNARKFGARGRKPSQLDGLAQLPQIPDDIICNNIIPRLPGKSLIRLKRVSKLWNSTILDLKTTFSGNVGRTKAAFMSFEYPKRSNRLQKPSFGNGTSEVIPNIYLMDREGRTEKFLMERTTKKRAGDGFIAGSCNGLLLIILGTSFYLWNPWTANFRYVLELKKLEHRYAVANSGICYNSFTDDYVVVIGLQDTDFYTPDFVRWHVLASGLKNKRWKKLKFPYQCHGRTDGVLCNGLLHWRANTNKDYRNRVPPDKIIAFDPNTDEISELPVPPCRGKEGESVILGLGVLDGCLCMARWEINQVDVIAMKEYGVEESWTPLFEISNLKFYNSPYYTKLTPLMVMQNGQVLMLMDCHPFCTVGKTIFSYNPQTMECSYDYPKVRSGSPHTFIENLY